MRPSIFCLIAACGAAPAAPAYFPALPGEAPAADAATCMPEGLYRVRVDLSSARISQVNTGMDGTEWCRSMLEAVPAAMMSTMRISREVSRLSVAWPHTRAVPVSGAGDCGFAIDEPPIAARFTFDGGRGIATTDYSTGTVNHPDERCTAEGARIIVEPIGAAMPGEPAPGEASLGEAAPGAASAG